MIHRALVYLLLMRLKNTVWELRRRPARLVAIVGLVVLFVTFAVGGQTVREVDDTTRLAVLVALLALYFLLSIFGGLGEPGPLFPPADVDFVFPAPFHRRQVLAYHLLRNYLHMVLLGLFYAVFLGAAHLPSPFLTYVGIVLCLVVCTHVQTAMTLISAAVSDRVFGRLRTSARLAMTGLLVVAVVFAIGGLSGVGDVGHVLRDWVGTGWARVLLYPAVAVGDLAASTTAAEAAAPLVGLLAVTGLSFLLVLAFPVNVLETGATRAERKRRAGIGTTGSARGHGVASRVFRGAGAVAWLNLVTLRRRLRIVVTAIVMLLFVMLFVGVRAEGATRGGVPHILVLLAYFPMLANLPLGFKGHREYLERLKTLPVGPARLAFAEVAVPALVLWGLQSSVVLILVSAGRLDPFWLLPAVVLYAVFDVAAVAVSDLFQLGQDRRQMGFLVITLQMVVIMASTLPAILAGALVFVLVEDLTAAGVAAALVQVGVDVALLLVLGRRFTLYEPPAHLA